MDNLCNNNSSDNTDSFVSNSVNRGDQDTLSKFDSINEEIEIIDIKKWNT